MNLVVGATGMLGSEICARLIAKGEAVRALVRSSSDQAKVGRLRGLGAELVQGDLRDHASLKEACRGVTAVISTASSMPFSYRQNENDIHTVDLEGATNLIDAARAAKVSQFIYTSFSGQVDLDFPLKSAKRAAEERLKDSGLVYTVLRPSYFMEVWLSPAVGFDVASAKVRVYGSGRNPISWISFQDVAQFAVESLDNPAAQHAAFELGGPEALSPLQVVKIFEEASGRRLEVEHVPKEALQAQQEAATDPMEQSFAGLMRCYAQGDPIDMRATLEAFPVRLISVQDYAKRVLA